MATPDLGVDYSGALGSNTGDVFHELWVIRQALKLLDESTDLTAITVEGVGPVPNGRRGWDGVDCALFFNGERLNRAERVELQQLKYSAANPAKNWTVGQVCRGKNGQPETSLVRRLASAFKEAVAERKSRPLDSIKISLVTNRPISPKLVQQFDQARSDVPHKFGRAWRQGDCDLHRLVSASGLSPEQFSQFAGVMDFRSEVGSRFALEDEVLKAIAELSDTEMAETARRLREYVRKRMLPEAAGEVIDKHKVLIQLGVSDMASLFPCPPVVETVQNPITRSVVETVTKALVDGEQRVCLHGSAGVGKTTVLGALVALLPHGSQIVIFDCYGGGRYLDASQYRHRPRDAFLQLSNDLARKLRLPMLLPPNTSMESARAFRKRLDIASQILGKAYPDALLVVCVDAADNSITAATSRIPAETSFVTELMSFEDLSPNIRLIVSTRTGHLDDLKMPSAFTQIECSAFTRRETAQNVTRYWQAPKNWIDDFHYFSGGVPRVQAYAFEQAESRASNALEVLQPAGVKLEQIFQMRFDAALTKSGQTELMERACAALSVLPRPIPITELAHVLGLAVSQVIDTCTDLAPGVRLQGECVSFGDEDFETFVREKGLEAEGDIRQAAADRLLANASSDEYAALNVAHVLFSAGRKSDLLQFVEQQPKPETAAVPDPVRSREIHDQRLLIASKVCRDAGDAEKALRFVLMGAEAAGSAEAIRSLLTSFPNLAIRFAKATTSRLVLGDPKRVKHHGPLLFFGLGEDARIGDAVGVREGRRRLRAWFEARSDAYEKRVQQGRHASMWEFPSEGVAADLYATVLLDGVEATLRRFKGARPIGFAISIARAFVSRLLSEGQHELVEKLALKCPPWKSIFLLVPLARAGHQIDLDRLAAGLQAVKRRLSLDLANGSERRQRSPLDPRLQDTLLSATEILVGHGVHPQLCTDVLFEFLDSDLRRIDKISDSDDSLLDAFLRCYCLNQAIEGKEVVASDVLSPRPAKPQETTAKKTLARHARDYDNRIRDLIRAVLPMYEERANVFVRTRSGKPAKIRKKTLKMAFAEADWRTDRYFSSTAIRARAAEVLADLIAVGANPHKVMKYAFKIRRGIWPQGGSSVGELCDRLTAIPELHGKLLDLITTEVAETRSKRIGAFDKSTTLAAFAEILIPISTHDAASVFESAVEVASELEMELMDQLRFLDCLVKRAKTAMIDDRRYYASVAADIVSDAAIRLDGIDHFPWNEAMSSIVRLDFSTALACVARWDDLGIAWRESTLPPVLAVGLKNSCVSGAQAAALTSFSAPLQLLEAILTEAAKKDDPATSALADEFAHDSLVDRIPAYERLDPPILQYGRGEWTSRYRRKVEFRKAQKTDGTLTNVADSQVGKSGSHNLDGVAWDPAGLLVAERLLNDANEVLKRLKDGGGYFSLGDVLKHASGSVLPEARVQHLDVLKRIPVGNSGWQFVDVILSAAKAWRGQLSVVQWCKSNLPGLIIERLPAFARPYPWEDHWLDTAFELAELSGEEAKECLLDGLARNTDDLEASSIFALAGLVAERLSSADAAKLCKWYLGRVLERIPAKYREAIDDQDIPEAVPTAVGRFLYAYMSDVDLRLRWRAAHALRRLARLGEGASVAETVAQYERGEEPAFRAKNEPFYWNAARLWLVMTLDRLSEEAPAAVVPHSGVLLRISLCGDYPHLLVRDYAADACQKLAAGAHLKLSDAQKSALAGVNQGLPPLASEEPEAVQPIGTASLKANARRFRFDTMDTVRYWYDGWISVFQGLSRSNFLEVAEKWIVDRWGVSDQPPSRLLSTRQHRFDRYRYHLSSNSHGAFPTLERYRNHLEWHAMWCAAGEFLRTHRLTTIEPNNYDSLTSAISQGKLTHPPQWLSDLVGPTPLQPHRWRPIDECMDDWLSNIDDSDFEREVFPLDRPGWVLVSAYQEVISDKHRETVTVSTGLVSPHTARALVRALQLSDSERDFYVCPEGHELEIDTPDFKLQGWLSDEDTYPRYDEKDPYRNGIGSLQRLPGKAVTEALGLEQRYGDGCLNWFRKGAEEPSFVYEAWGEEEPEDRTSRYYGETGVYSGRRLLVRKQDLADFLCAEQKDLILDIGVTRRDGQNSRRTYDTEGTRTVVFNRILLLRRGGDVEAAERSIGAWRKDCS